LGTHASAPVAPVKVVVPSLVQVGPAPSTGA
jgi:hypothetical protein